MALTQLDVDNAVARAIRAYEVERGNNLRNLKGYEPNHIDWGKASQACAASVGVFDPTKSQWHTWFEAFLNQAQLHGDLSRYLSGRPFLGLDKPSGSYALLDDSE